MVEARDYQLSEALRLGLHERVLKQCEDRINILEALVFTVEHPMELFELMVKSDDAMSFKAALEMKYGMTGIQAQAVVDMRLRAFSKADMRRLTEEYEEVLRTYVMATAHIQEGSKWHS